MLKNFYITTYNEYFGDTNLKFDIKTHKFDYGDSIFICSDGFYGDKAYFTQAISNLIFSNDLEKAIEQLFSDFSNSQKDDMTTLFFRRNDLSHAQKQDFSLDNLQLQTKDKIPAHIITNLLLNKLKENIQNKDKRNCLKILDFILIQNLKPSVNKLNNTITLITNLLKT